MVLVDFNRKTPWSWQEHWKTIWMSEDHCGLCLIVKGRETSAWVRPTSIIFSVNRMRWATGRIRLMHRGFITKVIIDGHLRKLALIHWNPPNESTRRQKGYKMEKCHWRSYWSLPLFIHLDVNISRTKITCELKSENMFKCSHDTFKWLEFKLNSVITGCPSGCLFLGHVNLNEDEHIEGIEALNNTFLLATPISSLSRQQVSHC